MEPVPNPDTDISPKNGYSNDQVCACFPEIVWHARKLSV